MNNKDNTWINYGTGEIRDDMISLEEFRKRRENQLNGYKYAKKEILPLPTFLQEEYGNFINAKYCNLLDKLNYDTATAFRFIYLCTYMDYNNGYILWKNKRVTEDQLVNIFDVHRNTMTKIKKGLYDNELIFKDNDNYIYVNSDYCYRGEVSNNKTYKNQYVRIFNNSIRELYNKSSNPREHKLLGKFILLLPYVNVYHNIVCMNIKEKAIENLMLPNSEQMDEILHTSTRDYAKQINELLKITVGGEPAVMVMEHNNARVYTVNPRIYYGGTRFSDVKTLNEYFKTKGGLY